MKWDVIQYHRKVRVKIVASSLPFTTLKILLVTITMCSCCNDWILASAKDSFRLNIQKIISIYIPWPFPPVWGVADNTKETTKTMGISLRSSSNDEGPSRVWMALLEQHSPSSPVFHNLRRFIDAISPYHRVASIRQPRGNSRCQKLCLVKTQIALKILYIIHL